MSITDGFMWTEASTSAAVEAWRRGDTASQIAAMLGGGVTRSAVLGKLNRLKITRGKRPARSNFGAVGGQTRAAGARVARLKTHGAGTREQLRRVAAQKPLRMGKGFESEGPVDADTEALRGDAWAALPGTVPVPLIALERGACKWPIGDPREPGFGFCGQPQASDDGRYCPVHAARSDNGLGKTVKQPSGTRPAAVRNARLLESADA